MTWYDSRLTYSDLRDEIGLNSLSPEEKEQIWIPVLVFDNTEDKPSTIVDEDTMIAVEKEGSFTLADIDQPIARQYYRGDENPIVLTRFYNIK